MTKLSGLPVNGAPGLNDAVVSVESPGTNPTDVQVTILNLLKLLSGNSIFSTTNYTNAGTAGGTGIWLNIGGLKALLITGITTSASAWLTINWSVVGFTSTPVVLGNSIESVTPSGWVEFSSYASPSTGAPNATGCSLLTRISTGSNAAASVNLLVIGT
jgi:hypothetical protein